MPMVRYSLLGGTIRWFIRNNIQFNRSINFNYYIIFNSDLALVSPYVQLFDCWHFRLLHLFRIVHINHYHCLYLRYTKEYFRLIDPWTIACLYTIVVLSYTAITKKKLLEKLTIRRLQLIGNEKMELNHTMG